MGWFNAVPASIVDCDHLPNALARPKIEVFELGLCIYKLFDILMLI